MMPVGPASSPSGVFLLSEAFSFEKAPEQVPSELPKVSETFLICPLMLGPTSQDIFKSQATHWMRKDVSTCCPDRAAGSMEVAVASERS